MCKILTRTRDMTKRMNQWRAKGVNRKGLHHSVYVNCGLSSGILICIFCLHRVLHCTAVKWKRISATFRKTLSDEGLHQMVKNKKVTRTPEPKKSKLSSFFLRSLLCPLFLLLLSLNFRFVLICLEQKGVFRQKTYQGVRCCISLVGGMTALTEA